MKNKVFGNKKNNKKLGLAIIAIFVLVFAFWNVRFQSVSEYKKQQLILSEEFLANNNSNKSNSQGMNSPQNNNKTNNDTDSSSSSSSSSSSETVTSVQQDNQGSSIRDTESELTSSQYVESQGYTSEDKGDIPSNTIGNSSNQTTAHKVLESVTCKIEIRCDALTNNLSNWTNKNKDFSKILPLESENGYILREIEITVNNQGFEKTANTVYAVLMAATKTKGIPISVKANSDYIEGINQLEQKDAGSLSGWMYKVNGVWGDRGCASYNVKDGDKISWQYTCNMGKDLN